MKLFVLRGMLTIFFLFSLGLSGTESDESQAMFIQADSLRVTADSLNALGDSLFKAGEVLEGIKAYNLELEVRKQLVSDSLPPLKYESIGDYVAALENRLKVMDVFTKVGAAYSSIVGDYKLAIQSYKESLKEGFIWLSPESPYFSEAYYNLGLMYRKEGENDSALAYLRMSIDNIERSFSEILTQGRSITQALNPEEILSLAGKPLGYTEEGFSLAMRQMKEPMSAYEQIISLLVEMKNPEEAFEYLERAKMKFFKESWDSEDSLSLGHGDLMEKTEQSKELEKEVKDLEQKLADEKTKPDSLRDTSNMENLSTSLANTKAEYFKVTSEIQADPDYAFAVKVDPVQLGTIKQDLPPGQVLLMGYASQEELYLFMVCCDGYEVRSVPVIRDSLDSLISKARYLCGAEHVAELYKKDRLLGWNWAQDTTAFYAEEVGVLKSTLAELYRYLIEPVEQNLVSAQVVTIIPSGNLYYVPWGALLDCDDGGEPLFLSERCNWHVMTSAELLRCIQRRDEKKASVERKVVLVGNPEGANLPYAETEVSAISSAYPNSTILTGTSATEPKVVDMTPESQALHLATHCVLNPRDPWDSYIQLASTEETDGHWTVAEISGQSWQRMQLVTLSACETALGGERPGLEFESMAKAFSLAMEGPPSIVATLWPVADESTKEFMVTFYKELKDNPKSEALRRAQQKLIHSGWYSHPFFWAPFILIGEWR
ncbi:CHAT domain-containing protein [candidate division WOR-3 bacterium]|nr:CHAT domain-containing protein [candidate division WOR-3 bacterium]